MDPSPSGTNEAERRENHEHVLNTQDRFNGSTLARPFVGIGPSRGHSSSSQVPYRPRKGKRSNAE